MDKIELAVLPRETPLVAAWVALESRQQSGLLRFDGSNLSVIHVRDVVVGMVEGKRQLSNLNALAEVSLGDIKIVSIQSPGRASWKLSKETIDDVYAGIAQPTFGSGQYKLGQLSLGKAWIITAHEGLAAALQLTPRHCYCTYPVESHDYDYNTHPAFCKRDGSKVVCV